MWLWKHLTKALDTFMVSGILLRMLSRATMEASRHGRMCPVKTRDKAIESSRLSSKMPGKDAKGPWDPEGVCLAPQVPRASLLCCAPRFPFSRPELLKEWVLTIGRGDFEPKQHTVICSEHFRPECFSAFGNRKNLKHNAVPTVFAFQGPPQVHGRGGPPPGSGVGTSVICGVSRG